jgi:hypothetical protein
MFQANLGEGYLEDLSSLSAEELNSLGTFYASKPAESVLHGGFTTATSGLIVPQLLNGVASARQQVMQTMPAMGPSTVE